MKLTFISDTHSMHRELGRLMAGDVLVHCGDLTGYGRLEEVQDFALYMVDQPFEHKVVIAGNHDTCFEDDRQQDAEKIMADHGIIYLNDSAVEIEGVKFWGSPIQPEFFNWAFQRERGAEIRECWEMIPDDTDVLLTHGPAFEILDLCDHGGSAGCEDLLEVVQRIKPKIHACGHVHEAYGVHETADTIFVNACNLDVHYHLKNPPIVLEL